MVSVGLASSPVSPFHARLTTWAATSCFLNLREFSHHWPVRAIIPTSIWAYMGAALGSSLWLLNSAARMCSTWLAMSLIRLAKDPVACPAGLSRTRMRKPSVEVST